MVDKINEIVLDDRRFKVCEISETLGISGEWAENWFEYEYLDLSKLVIKYKNAKHFKSYKNGQMSMSSLQQTTILKGHMNGHFDK